MTKYGKAFEHGSQTPLNIVGQMHFCQWQAARGAKLSRYLRAKVLNSSWRMKPLYISSTGTKALDGLWLRKIIILRHCVLYCQTAGHMLVRLIAHLE